MKNVVTVLVIAAGLFVGSSAMANSASSANSCNNFARVIKSYSQSLTTQCNRENVDKYIAVRVKLIKNCTASCAPQYCWTHGEARRDLEQVRTSCLSNERYREIRKRFGDSVVQAPPEAAPPAPVETAKQTQQAPKAPTGDVVSPVGPVGPGAAAPAPAPGGGADAPVGASSIDAFCAASRGVC